ncbi:hypothetical protein [Herbiconiux sp. UC225_62]|uniref:hypothetical protein n=1 Tax=Herbiconiux sp. UC225_62 TaxID=3350168 RepID=UPI0036D351F0
MGSHSSDPAADPDPVPPSVRAQLLATEHWGLLAARGTAQNEVLTRIAIFFTLVSAGLVSLALIGQATGFAESFSGFSLGIIGFVCFVGLLTQLRVFAVGMEDLMYVVAMNRLRGAYDELDPGIAQYFMASRHDDLAGSLQTYYFFLPRRSDIAQVLASSMIFVAVVNAALVGLFAGAVTMSLGAHPVAAIAVGVIVGFVWLATSAVLGERHYRAVWKGHVPLFPS